MGNLNCVTLSANIPQCCFGINYVKRNIRFTVLVERVLLFFCLHGLCGGVYSFWCLFQLFWTLSTCLCYGFAAAWHDQCIVEDSDRHEVRIVRI